MKAYGKNKKLAANHPDVHPPKGYVNWWEKECSSVIKKRERQEAKKDIKRS